MLGLAYNVLFIKICQEYLHVRSRWAELNSYALVCLTYFKQFEHHLVLLLHLISQRVGFLEQFASVRLQTVIYTSKSWTSPADRLWIGGELELIQSEPFPASGLVDQYNTSPINFSSTTVDDYDASTILSRYNERNGK